MAIKIEEELHSLFKETNAKYKAKYRSLMFNIKDKSNLTLFRKIADKSISPFQLVRLSPEELASQELAQWREREARHQLEMIKKTELDAMQLSKTVVMKTHKGEQIVENEDGLKAKVLETSVEIEPVNISPITPASEVPVTKLKDNLGNVKDKHMKKDKKDDRHKERRQSNKSGHRKDDERSRSRHRSRHRSGSRSKSKPPIESKERNRSTSLDEENKLKEKTEGKQLEKSKNKNQTTERSRSRHRRGERERSKSRPRSDRERSKSKESYRSKSRPRDGSKSKPRERSRSRPKERSKSKDEKELSDVRSKSQTRSRSKSRPRERSRSKSRHGEKLQIQSQKSILEPEDKFISAVEEEINHSQSMSNKLFEDFNIFSAKPAILDSEVKEIIQDVVESEEKAVIDENLSDQEPSSTVNICTPPFNALEEEEELLKPPVWKGTLLMPDVAKFSTSIQEVSGSCGELEFDLPDTLNCVGRISPETAWDYIAKMKKSGTKQILVVKFVADNEEDKMSYLSFYSYLSSRSRLGVVGNNSKMIKDFYILPLPSHSPVPQVLLPLDGPGFEDFRPHLLLGIVVRTKRKRIALDKDLPFVPKVSKKSERSYTPPLPDEGSHTPTQQHPDTESFTPPHSPKPPRFIKLKSQTSRASDSPTVSDDYVLEDGDTPYTPEDEVEGDAPYSPGEATSPPCSAELQRKVDQLHRMISDIEEKKQKIDSIVGMSPPQEIIDGTAALEEEQGVEEEIEEVYSPSGSLTPPIDSSYLGRNSSKISLPSDLQEIITSLTKKTEEPKSMDLKSDPIVQAYKSTDEPYSPEDEKFEDDRDEDDKQKDDKGENDEDENELESVVEDKTSSPPLEENASTQSSVKNIKLNRDPRQRHTHVSLSQLSDDEVMKKASEMGFMNPENPEPIPDMFKSRSSVESPALGTKAGYVFTAEEERLKHSSMAHQPPLPGAFINQTFTSSQPPFTPNFPPPPMPPNFLPNQFQAPHVYTGPPVPPIPPLPPSHVPFTNPQPPPPPPPPPSHPVPPPPLSPSESLSSNSTKKKKSKKKSRDPRSRKEKKEKRRYSESPPPKSYGYDKDKFDKSREREKHSSKKRERRDSWRSFDDRRDLPEKRRESWEYEQTPQLLPPQAMHGPPPHPFGMPGPMMGGPMRGRFPRGMRRGSGRGDFNRPSTRGFHRGGFHLRGHRGSGPPPGPSRNIHSEVDEDIRRFEEQRLKQKILDRKRWDNESPPPRKRRMKDDDDSD